MNKYTKTQVIFQSRIFNMSSQGGYLIDYLCYCQYIFQQYNNKTNTYFLNNMF